MVTRLDIDSELIEKARQAGHHTTKKAAVIAALQEYITKREQLKILDLFGTIEYGSHYNYKKQRRKN